jgi:hypothetical protein
MRLGFRGIDGIGRAGSVLGAMALLGLSACADGDRPSASAPPPSAETIAISVGPCFGFCPVYQATVTPAGKVGFSGERHTAVLGARERDAGADVYRALARDLAPFRPADGQTAAVECEAAISDTSRYTITWIKPDGSKTEATHQRGCSGGPGKALDAILRDMDQRLGIADWAKQTTRPGVSRG